MALCRLRVLLTSLPSLLLISISFLLSCNHQQLNHTASLSKRWGNRISSCGFSLTFKTPSMPPVTAGSLETLNINPKLLIFA
ncbi:unnamed protein product [Protopolystoma xenopodis]|uniref:Secreted protein n=1 Tax=Protopolystoma xenopodis TaxID=117903 RepID=A0A448XBG4_9PLAT|nr:unnamed protein product [Protopolystoma xenopodis]